MQNIKTIPQLAVQNLPADLESKADADEVVFLTGNQTVEGNKNLTETPVIQLWNADINPTANQTIVFSINSVGTFELYKNKTGSNGNNPPAQDGTNWEFISTCQGSRAYVQEFAPSESPVSSITLTEGICYNADFMTVAVDHTILDPSAYTLGINGTTITFVEPVEAGLTITVRWFTEMNLSNVYRQPLLTCFWSDHLIYELSYSCADPFSWQDGNVYSAAYNHLVADIEGKSIITEGLITYYLADDGHKIATAVSHDAVANLYDETGVAWFYILDVENHRFKLPRTKYAFSGWRGDVGDYIPESLPNISGSTTAALATTTSATPVGAIYASSSSGNPLVAGGNSYGSLAWNFDASRSSSTYQDSAPVQQRGTQMYLYFYVGNYTPQAVEQTAGYAQTLSELKANKSLDNLDSTGQSLFDAKVNVTTFNQEINKKADYEMTDGNYSGVSLNDKFASDITSAGSIWTFLHNRAQAGNYDGIHIGDYFDYQTSAGQVAGIHINSSTPNVGTLSLAAATRRAYIMGLDTYTGTGDAINIGHQIACFSMFTDCFVMWNPTNNNNGTSANNTPWLASQLYAVMNGVSNNSSNTGGATGYASSGKGFINLFPTEAKNVIVTKRALLGTRYSASATLTNSNNLAWVNMGQLWALSEIEVYGCMIHSTSNSFPQFNSYGNSIQYPLFAKGLKFGRNLFAGYHYWLCSPCGNNTTHACGVDANGGAACGSTTTANRRGAFGFNIQ